MFSTYIVVSALSLAVDWLILVALTAQAHMNPGWAAALAYLLGAVVHYSLSRTHVFRSRATGQAHLREAVWFGTSCLFGAALTATIVALLASVVGAVVAKVVAIAVSFVVLYLVRRFGVFAGSAAGKQVAGVKRAGWAPFSGDRSGTRVS
jgi:putative flippase GtrA